MESNIIVLGAVGSGKSWFLNQILGKKEFKEAWSAESCTKGKTVKSKNILDNINRLEYKMNLYDTSGTEEGFQEAFDTLQKIRFNQIVIVTKIAFTRNRFSEFLLDQELKDRLRKIAAALGYTLSENPDSVTLVINQISKMNSDEEVIEFRQKICSVLGVELENCICIHSGILPRDCIFSYLVHSNEDGYQFQERNFLAILGQSPPILHKINGASNIGILYRLILIILSITFFFFDLAASLCVGVIAICFKAPLSYLKYVLRSCFIWTLGIAEPFLRPSLSKLIILNRCKSFYKKTDSKLQQFDRCLALAKQPELPY